MLLTITSTASATAPDATDLGYLLHKHPDRAQRFSESVGVLHVFYPEATANRCTAALLLEVDPIALVRSAGRTGGSSLAEYVNDRPYVASSMMAVAMARAFNSALAGRCTARPELVDRLLPLEIRLPVVPCRGGTELVARLFAPLGWTVQATGIPLDPELPEWGSSDYLDLRLTGELRLADALSHLYVLLPVLDDGKHYWVGDDEVDKLLRVGGRWLPGHPERELISARYLAHQRGLVSSAVGRLAQADDSEPAALDNALGETPAPARQSLARLRREAVLAVLRDEGAARIVDFGCGEGALLRELLTEARFTAIVGADVSDRALRTAERRLGVDQLPDRQRDRLTLLQSSLTYRDERLAGFDAGVLMEVIEHLELSRLPALESSVFGFAQPQTVVVTTPNVEYNVHYPDLPAGAMRHPDHRFEWTRAEFQGWANRVAAAHPYAVEFQPVGPMDPELGSPTQLAIFRRGAR